MRRLKTLSAGLLGALIAAFLALPVSLHAQSTTLSIVEKYDLDSTTLTFCRLSPNPVQGLGSLITSGSNTAVTAATGTPFAGLGENDVLYALSPATGAVETRYITTWTSSTAVTVDVAVDWSTTGGTNFTYKDLQCGTTATDGWFDMGAYVYASIIVNVAQIVATGGINFRWECRGSAPLSAPVQVCPTLINTFRNVASGGAGITDGSINCAIEEPYAACRVGMAIGSADDGGDLTTNREQISIQNEVRRPQ